MQNLWRAYKAFGDPNVIEADERKFYEEQVRVCQLIGMPAELSGRLSGQGRPPS